MTLTTWPAKDQREKLVATFSFGPALDPGETIESHLTSCTSKDGADTHPSAVLDGAGEIVGSDVLQSFHGGISGASYCLDCTVNLSSGRVLVLSAILPVRRPAF